MSKFTLARCDDWECLYVDGVAVEQGHSIDLPWILQQHGVDIERKPAYEWMTEQGGGWFPEKLEEVVFDA